MRSLENEPHIVINTDRTITVPPELMDIAVQYDHNVETVTFDCPRYWDDIDMSKMIVSIEYTLPNGIEDSYVCPKVTIDEADDSIMHFTWTISSGVTQEAGTIEFLVCIKELDADEAVLYAWHSKIYEGLNVLEGKYCSDKVMTDYEEGRNDEYDSFWDIYQDNGNRQSYNMAFGGTGWTDDTFNPKYNIVPTQANNMFNTSYIVNLKGILDKLGVTLDFSQTSYASNCFSYSSITDVGVVDCANAVDFPPMFTHATRLKNIEKIVIYENQTFPSVFNNALELENVVFDGVIGKNGLNLQWSTKLSKDSLLSLLNCLQDKTGDTTAEWKVTIGTTNKAKLTDSELLIASNKGWGVE